MILEFDYRMSVVDICGLCQRISRPPSSLPSSVAIARVNPELAARLSSDLHPVEDQKEHVSTLIILWDLKDSRVTWQQAATPNPASSVRECARSLT